MTAALPLPPPTAAALVRDAISAAEALRALTLAHAWQGPRASRRFCGTCALRLDEALAAVRVLAATLVDVTGDESHERVRTARSIAGRLRLADLEAHDLDGFEAWCREVAR